MMDSSITLIDEQHEQQQKQRHQDLKPWWPESSNESSETLEFYSK